VMGLYSALNGSFLPTFRGNLLIPTSRVISVPYSRLMLDLFFHNDLPLCVP
jgi:hypothetical protein